MIRLFALVIDRLVLSLPLVMVAVLALGSYWMVRSAPSVDTSPSPHLQDDTPDYVVEGFTLQKFDATGQLKALLQGKSAQHLPDARWIEIEKFTFFSTDALGRVKRASADRGLSNQDSNEFQLLGRAHLVREAHPAGDEPRIEMQSDALHVWTTADKVVSDRPVQITHGKHLVQADSLHYDGNSRTLQLDGRVHATLNSQSPPQ